MIVQESLVNKNYNAIGMDEVARDIENIIAYLNVQPNLAQLYMNNNSTATVISNTTDFVKIAGTTLASSENHNFSHSNNRLTCEDSISKKYLIQCSISFTDGNNHICEFGFYDSKLNAIRTPSKTKATSNSSSHPEALTLFCLTTMEQGDYLEVHCRNTEVTTNILANHINFLITEIK